MPAHVKVQSLPDSKFAQQISAGEHRLWGDEPAGVGGSNRGPSPYEYLLAALGSCTSMTLRMYADRKGWDLQEVQVNLYHQRIHASDCNRCETETGLLDQIQAKVQLKGALDDSQRARLLEIAGKCPVHRTLSSEVHIRIESGN